MGFLTSLVEPLRRKSASPDWGTLERYLAWAFGGGASSTGIVVNPQTALQAATVYSCIKVLSESIGSLPLNIYREASDGSKSLAKDHPLFELLHDQPNDWMTSVDLREMMVAHLNLRGNFYAYLNRTRSGRIVEILPIHPDCVRVNMGPDWDLSYEVTLQSGEHKTLDAGQLWHIRGLTLNGWLGLSPISYARESIGLALATEKFGGQLFRSGAKMGGVLTHPSKLSDQAYQRIKESFDLATSGENAHKTAVLEEGMKFEKVTMPADDAQFLETRKYQRSEIAAIFRVPPHMIGDLERATFSNIEQQSLEYVTYTLLPWLNRIEQSIRRDLMTKAERTTLAARFQVSGLLRGDAKARAEFYASGITNGWLTRNEARGLEDLNPLEGLDVPLRPLNLGDGTDDPDEADDTAEGETPESETPAGDDTTSED